MENSSVINSRHSPSKIDRIFSSNLALFFPSRDTKRTQRVTNPSAELNVECVLFALMRGDFEESSAG